ncbi:MAG TPA: hypothetical protein VNZ01_14275 [Solirubrobacteraceae bacterium]|jgi:hypothetical protein|nr:hypothetical protein [Solirubrobacteraceae bacterium]
MIVKKTLLAAAAGALMAGSTWALPGLAPAAPGNGHAPGTTPNNIDNPGSSHRSSQGTENTGGKGGNQGEPGGSHKCKPHKVGYVASGTLVSQTLTKNADGSYSGEVTVEVKHTNHHAKGDKGTKTYKVANVHLTFGLADTNNDGSVGLDDLMVGDRATLLGQITVLTKGCSNPEFVATTTIRHLVFHAPATP